MNTKVVKQPSDEARVRSLDSIAENKRPTQDFRVLIANSETLEESMTADVTSIEEQRTLLNSWKKAKALLDGMIQRLSESLEKAERAQKQIDEAKEELLARKARSGYPHRMF